MSMTNHPTNNLIHLEQGTSIKTTVIFISVCFHAEILKKCNKINYFVANSVENLNINLYYNISFVPLHTCKILLAPVELID